MTFLNFYSTTTPYILDSICKPEIKLTGCISTGLLYLLYTHI